MCRIFGFRSILQSGVHKSLIDADNSIIHQSDRHPDGWGVAYYNMGSPHLIKMDQQARECQIFAKVSGLVSSNTVVAHIRKSTVGSVGPLNTHPFQFGPWVFAHNGNLRDFESKRPELLDNIDKELRPYVLGETDSEHLFFFLLTVLKRKGLLLGSLESDNAKDVLQDFLVQVHQIFGSLVESKGDYTENYVTFLLTNGASMLTFNGGQKLFYSTHKSQCPDRSSCSYHAPVCEEEPAVGQKVHHFLASSEVINNENVWFPLKFGEGALVDSNFRFSKVVPTI